MNAAVLTAALSLALAGCQRDAGNPTAPGSPGTGNPSTVVTPAAPETPPGGPSGVKGSVAHPGSSGGDAVRGATGRGTSDPGGRSQTVQPGTGLQGGLGGSAGMGMSGSTPGGTGTSATGAPAGGVAGEGGTQRTPPAQGGNR